MRRALLAAALLGACDGGKDVGLPPMDDTDVDTDVEVIDTDRPPVADTFDEHAVPELVELDPGEFELGATTGEIGASASERSHMVTLTHRVAVGAYEVTQAQFKSWMGYNPAYWGGCARCPVERLSWHEAAAYTNKLSEAEGLMSCFTCAQSDPEDPATVRCQPAMTPYACDGYRLPTEAEWEYAAREEGTVRGATTSNGSLTRVEDLESCADPLTLSDGTELADLAWYCGNSDATPGKTTRPVGGRLPNGLGMYDVMGNVWELCMDAWSDQYPLEAEIDPIGPVGEVDRVVRGGGWNSTPRLLRLGFRTSSVPQNASDNLGFRLARTLDPTPLP